MMELWLDTVEIELITQACNMLNITGITTNPTIISKSQFTLNKALKTLLDCQPGKVAVQVTAKQHHAIVEQAQYLYGYSNRIIIKIPVTTQGLAAIKTLNEQAIPTMATAIFQARQVMLAVLAGAHYAAPYLGRINKTKDCFTELRDMLQVVENYKSPLKIIGAALENVEQVMHTLSLKTQAITIPPSVFQALTQDYGETTQSIQKFDEDWQSRQDLVAEM